MWSGSVLPGKTSIGNQPYSGVGLELYENNKNYFRYSTSDNILDIATQTFILGDIDQTYIYGDTSSLLISSPNFDLDANGNVTMTGIITATGGNIGGFAITQDAITGSGFFLSGSATGNGFFISSSKFNVKANGDVTASSALFSGSVSVTGNINATTGNIGGFAITRDAITGSGFYLSGSATGNGFFISSSKFNVKANGDVTASSALFSGSVSVTGNINATTGNIGGFAITRDAITGSGVLISGSATTGTQFFISSSKFNVKGNGDVTGSNVLFTGGKIAGFTINNNTLSNGTEFYISGSATGNDFFISSSKFNVKALGDITASAALFSGNVSAVNFSKKMITVTNTNSASYFQTITAGNINLIFDGSSGGEKTLVMEIACPTNPSLNIKDIIVSNTGSGLMPQVEVIISQNNVTFDNSTIKTGTALAIR
jgi:hypothetical protein